MGFTLLCCENSEKERKVSEYYKKQEKLLEGFNEMETINETGFVSGAPTVVRTTIDCFLQSSSGISFSEIFSVFIIYTHIASLLIFNRKK